MKFNKIKKILLVGLSLMLLTACDSKAPSNQSVSDKEDINIDKVYGKDALSSVDDFIKDNNVNLVF